MGIVYHAKSIQTTAIESHGSRPIPPNCWTTHGLWRVRQKPTSIRIFLTTAATEDFRDPKDAAIGDLRSIVTADFRKLGPDSSHFYPLLSQTHHLRNIPKAISQSNVAKMQRSVEGTDVVLTLGSRSHRCPSEGRCEVPGWRHHAHFITLKHTKKKLMISLFNGYIYIYVPFTKWKRSHDWHFRLK